VGTLAYMEACQQECIGTLGCCFERHFAALSYMLILLCWTIV